MTNLVRRVLSHFYLLDVCVCSFHIHGGVTSTCSYANKQNRMIDDMNEDEKVNIIIILRSQIA